VVPVNMLCGWHGFESLIIVFNFSMILRACVGVVCINNMANSSPPSLAYACRYDKVFVDFSEPFVKIHKFHHLSPEKIRFSNPESQIPNPKC